MILQRNTSVLHLDASQHANSCKGNIVGHMKNCAKQKMRKEQNADSKVCPYCAKVFVQKSNGDRHVKNQHEDSDFNHTFADETFDDGTVVPLTFVSEFDRNDQPEPSNLSPSAYASDIESIFYQQRWKHS